MQHSARMRIERDYCGHRAGSTRTLDDRAHDQLVTEMQTVKDTECEHGRTLNLGVVSSVKETHHSTINPS
jgi:hypothetical protein